METKIFHFAAVLCLYATIIFSTVHTLNETCLDLIVWHCLSHNLWQYSLNFYSEHCHKSQAHKSIGNARLWTSLVAHVCFRHFTCNYAHYSLSSCIGLHTSSPPLYTQSFILHAHAIAGCDMCHHHLYFYRLATARPCYIGMQPLINVLAISAGYC